MAAGEVRTRTGVAWLDEELGALRFLCAQGSECSLADAVENIEAAVKVARGKVLPILCDISPCKSMTREARARYAASEAFSALALVSDSPVGNILGNIFLAVYASRSVPTRLFHTDADAVQWLKGLMVPCRS